MRYLVTHEWVRKAEDALWRRTKLGMWMTDEQQALIADWLAHHSDHREPPQTV